MKKQQLSKGPMTSDEAIALCAEVRNQPWCTSARVDTRRTKVKNAGYQTIFVVRFTCSDGCDTFTASPWEFEGDKRNHAA